MNARRIKVDYMARVEGEASLDVEVVDGRIVNLQLRVFEPPRFFQGMLVGRHLDEVPGLVSRICGICPVSHQLTAIQALEDALGFRPPATTRALRRLLALSQFIQSHTLHLYMLAIPDFLGYGSALAMAGEHGPEVERALRLKRLGNDLTAAIGGREVHPVTPVVGGFTRFPEPGELAGLKERLREAMQDAVATVRLAARLPVPEFCRDTEHVALRHPGEYAVNEGRLVSTAGLDIAVEDYRQHIREEQVPYSNALQSRIVGRGAFMVGPLARVNLNFPHLSPVARDAAAEVGVGFPSTNPFRSIVARALEVVHAIEESISIIGDLDGALKRRQGAGEESRGQVAVRAGTGQAITEAPRGILYHRYRVSGEGLIEEADIVTPTAHHVRHMEEDLREIIPTVLDLPGDEATRRCEMVIRNYDPCFSCSAHFLRLRVTRRL